MTTNLATNLEEQIEPRDKEAAGKNLSEKTEKNIEEMARTVATVLGECQRRECQRRMDDAYTITIDDWVADACGLIVKIHSSVFAGNHNNTTEIRVKKFFGLLSKLVYASKNGNVMCYRPDYWEGKLGLLYLKALQFGRVGQDFDKVKEGLDYGSKKWRA